jgi:dTDP-4-dehydrorhamnose 3,5-epimerase
MIEGVRIRKLKPIPDERGYLMEMLRSDWEEFEKFG